MTPSFLLALSLLTAPDPAADLVVEARLVGASTLARGEYRGVEAFLVNRSKTQTHHVVRSGDGSEMGWREPWVWLTGEMDTPSGPVPIHSGPLGRCGLYDHDWQKDIVALAPGEQIKLAFIPQVSWALDLPNQGTVRFRVHYAWRRPGKRRSPIDPNTIDGPLRDVPPYELVSAPVALRLRTPVSATLRVKRSARAGRTQNVASLFDLRITEGRGLVRDVRFELRNAKHVGHRPQVEWRKGFTGSWHYPEPDTFEIRALLGFEKTTPSGEQRGAAATDWVRVTLR